MFASIQADSWQVDVDFIPIRGHLDLDARGAGIAILGRDRWPLGMSVKVSIIPAGKGAGVASSHIDEIKRSVGPQSGIGGMAPPFVSRQIVMSSSGRPE